ncbi:hypothetical protein H0E87_009435 [Populus deltoides]|uniref:PHD finger family protein n=1 Tax=Populus deltoides TaxID=3696 RepID=A0A8T2Z560_POPDE|nr:hypothetical protein H0E87_009435 [Populus deltoides]
MAKTRPGGLISKPKTGKRDLDSYTIRGTTKVVRVGDCVMMRPSDTGRPSYVARIEGMEADSRNNVKVRVRWYYRPEESLGGRRQFHGAKELFLSDHYDVQSAHTIEGKCIVHSFKNYTKLENVGAEDYYCRFEYKAATGGFTPDRVAVYCKCEMPYNPDDLMVQCEGCKDWYHPACVDMTIEEAKKLDHFVCSECASDDDVKRSQNGFSVSSVTDVKEYHFHFYTFPDPLSSSSGIWRVGRKQAPEEMSAVSRSVIAQGDLNLLAGLACRLLSKHLILDPSTYTILGDAPHRRSSNNTALGLALSRYSSVKSERLQQYFTISELNTLHTATIEYGSYGLYVNGETLAFHGSHLSHEGRKLVQYTTPSQANKLKDATRVKLVEKDRGAEVMATYTPRFLGLPQGVWVKEGGDKNAGEGIIVSARYFSAGAQAIATDLNISVGFFSPFDVGGHGRVPVIVDGFYHGKASEMAPRARIAVYKAVYTTVQEL